MESERNEEAGTSDNQEKEVVNLNITIPAQNIKILLETHKFNQHNAAMDIVLGLVRDKVIQMVKQRHDIDLS